MSINNSNIIYEKIDIYNVIDHYKKKNDISFDEYNLAQINDDVIDYILYGGYKISKNYKKITKKLERSKSSSGIKWNTLKQNGVMFPPKYIKHDVPLIYDGNEIVLDELAEEYATIYAKYIDTEYITSKVFKKNFWHDWKKILGNKSIIQDFDKCDFSKIYDYLVMQKEIKNNMTKEEKEALKLVRDDQESVFKVAFVDGEAQPVGNYRLEPPGIFIGRGCHPKLGSIKKRVMPEDIIINIGKGEEVPILPEELKDHKWKKIIHDRTLEWLASWIDNVTNKRKYVWLGSHSKFKADSDIKKFDLARKLKKKIGQIRTIMYDNLKDPDMKTKQAATAIYLIDNFALRVGNEKGDDSADTVGVTSLRVEHIIFHDDKKSITLDFLGKDSVRYKQTHQVDDQVYENLKEFTKNKSKNDDLLDIDSSYINKYLQSFMTDLTAKVYRTFNASNVFQKELNKIHSRIDPDNLDVNFILNLFNKANLTVAQLCNHQKKVSKSFDDQLDKITDMVKQNRNKINKIKRKESKSKTDNEKIKKLKDKINELKAKKEMKIDLKSISLETSKANYIDPRIVVAFSKKFDIPMDKLYSKTLLEKFKWAFDVDADWKF